MTPFRDRVLMRPVIITGGISPQREIRVAMIPATKGAALTKWTRFSDQVRYSWMGRFLTIDVPDLKTADWSDRQ